MPPADLAAAMIRSSSDAANAIRGIGSEDNAAMVRPPLTTERLEIFLDMTTLPECLNIKVKTWSFLITVMLPV